jgi:GNAT superfamily N-acetyltransferase
LCLRSKAVWGYDEAFIEKCREELTVTVETLHRSRVQVAIVEHCIVGVAEILIRGATVRLEKLFVEPGSLRSGVGRALFEWCASVARDEGADELVIDSDPGAAEFYRRMGAVDQGSVASGSIPGRRIPRLRFGLR